jgi:phosphinothricin acetyltransferase
MVSVRPATDADLERINEIYNHYIRTSPATFDLEPKTIDERREWFEHYADRGRHRVLVAADGSGVIGFASSSRHRPKAAYDTSVETSIYLAPEATGRGVGSLLYQALFAALAGEDLHRAYAGITMPNPASVALHERFGFRLAGTYTEQGYKFDRYWDVTWWEKEL